jgi:hypothetical protein
MMPFRLSVRGLMLLVVFTSCGFAALGYPTKLGASALLLAALALPTFGILAAFLGRGISRAFWLGVVVFGWIGVLAHFGPGFSTTIAPHLPSTAILQIAHPWILPVNPYVGGMRPRRGLDVRRAMAGRSMGLMVAPRSSPVVVPGVGGGMGGMGGVLMGRQWVPDIRANWTARQYRGLWDWDGPYEVSGYSLSCLLCSGFGGFIASVLWCRRWRVTPTDSFTGS